jgi:hypothetical protein
MAGTPTWTEPRDWVDQEEVDADIMNEQVRDNLTYLKAYGADGGLNPFLLMGA